MLHVALDNQPSTSRDVAPVIVAPHFPSGLAVSLEEGMQFNFNLFLYDSLRLPAGLFPDDQTGEVVFKDLQTCRNYCSRYVQSREEWCSWQQQESDHSQERRNELSKEDMFLTTGEALDRSLKCGNEAFDRNLNLVCLYLFGNVMILNAPHWSDVSAVYTWFPSSSHGQPSWNLAWQYHCGSTHFKPGNSKCLQVIWKHFLTIFFFKKQTNKQKQY